jgi:DNA-binding FadR family transcriptional regulator
MQAIAGGQYVAGQLLPKEELLAAEFDVARGTAREALRALEERRVVAVKHGRGARVRPADDWNVLDPVVARALVAGRQRREFLREVRSYRRILESEAAALAADRASRTERAALRAAADELAGGGDITRTATLIRRLVAIASGNRPLAATLRALDDALEPSLKAAEVDACARLADAVANADPDAARDAAGALNTAA